MTLAEFRRRIRAGHPTVVLAEMDYMYQVGVAGSAVPTLGTKYFATAKFNAANKYDDCLAAVPNYERSLDRSTLQGRYGATVGSMELANEDRARDSLLNLAIDGSEVRVYIGFPEDGEIYHLFSAMSLRHTAPNVGRLRIDLRAADVLLNKSIGGMVAVGGTDPSANRYRPVNFGFVHQVEPILLDHTIPRYVHSDTGTNTRAVAVRNDGVAVTFTDNADGTFDLAVPPTPSEVITCDVLADVDGSDLAYRGSDMIDWLVGDRCGLTALGRYAGAQATFTVGGFNDYHLGRNINEATNVGARGGLLDEIANSLNSFHAVDRVGNLYYGTMRPEALYELVSGSGGTITIAAEIGVDDIDAGPDGRNPQIEIDQLAPTYTGYQARGNVNWFDQRTFSSSLTDTAERDLYTREGYVTAGYFGEDPGTTSYLGPVSFRGGAPQLYHLTMSDSQVVDTLISGPDDTTVIDAGATPPQSVENYLQDWASVRRSKRLPWIEFLDITVGLDLAHLEIGEIVRVTLPMYGLDAGVLHQVCSINIQPTARQVQLGLVRRRYAGVLDEANGTPLYAESSMALGALTLSADATVTAGSDWFLDNFDGSAAHGLLWRPQVMSQPSSGRLILNRAHPLTSRLIFSAYNSAEDWKDAPVNYVDGRRGLSATNITADAGPPGQSSVPKGNGTSSLAIYDKLDLSPYPYVSGMFWLYWDAFFNDNKTAMCYGNWGTDNALLVMPNESGSGGFLFGTTAASTYAVAAITRPSAAAWHHYAFSVNRNVAVNAGLAVWMDGIRQSVFGSWTWSGPGTAFGANKQLHILGGLVSGTQRYGAGRIANLNLWSRFITDIEVREMYRNSLQIFNGAPSFA